MRGCLNVMPPEKLQNAVPENGEYIRNTNVYAGAQLFRRRGVDLWKRENKPQSPDLLFAQSAGETPLLQMRKAHAASSRSFFPAAPVDNFRF